MLASAMTALKLSVVWFVHRWTLQNPWRSLQEDPLLQLPEPMDTQIAMLIDAYRSGQITRREFHEAMSLLKQEMAVDEKKANRQASEDGPNLTEIKTRV